MKTLLKTTVATVILTASSAYAAVTLHADEHIKVTAINGKAVNQGLFQPLQKEFSLDAGRHVITARYDRMFDLTHKEHDHVKSANITLTAELSDNQSYRLVMPNQPSAYSEAREYAKAPSLAIMQGNTIIASESTVSERRGLLSGLSGVFARDAAVTSNQQTIAAITATPQTATPSTPPTATVRQNSTLDSFMQLWLNASDEERAKIRQWVQE
ncbi:MAG: DUF2057 domain-containing protein [Moraxella sp.]|nr:DUF2057 domain-containing protein [Moraxella sp.]